MVLLLTTLVLAKCKKGMYQYENFCVSVCPLDKRFSNGNYCVAQCKQNQFHDLNTFQCVDQCPSNYYTQTNQQNICVNECRYKIFNNEIDMFLCLDKCPDSAPFYSEEGNSCTPTCDSNIVKLDSNNHFICIESCENYYKQIAVNNFIVNQCVDNCSPNEYLLEKECLESCTEKNLIADESGKCVEKCDSFIYKNNDKELCVNHCPSNASFITKNESEQLICSAACSKGFQLKRYAFENQSEIFAMTCVDDCEQFVNNTQLCDLGYSNFQYINVSITEKENTLVYTDIEKCENYIYMDKFCIPTCSDYVLYKDNITYCVSTPETQHYVIIQQQKIVVNNCSEVSDLNQYYIVDGLTKCALTNCPKYSKDGQCMESCKEYGMVYDEKQKLCIPRYECNKQINTTGIENYCQKCEYYKCQQCSINAYIYVNDVKRCGKIDTTYLPINGGTEYVVKCPDNSIFYDQKQQQCISKCNITYQDNEQYMCIKTCDTMMYEPSVWNGQKSFICLSKCKNKNLFVIINNQIICQPECDMMYFNYDTMECVANCDAFYNEEHRKCVPRCNKYYYLNDHTNHRQCTQNCPINYMSDNLTNECLIKTLKKQNEQSSFTTIILLGVTQFALLLIIVIISAVIIAKYKRNRRQQKQISLPQILNAMITKEQVFKYRKRQNALIPRSIFDAKSQVPVIIYNDCQDITSDNKASKQDEDDWTKHIQPFPDYYDAETSSNVKEKKMNLQQLFI